MTTAREKDAQLTRDRQLEGAIPPLYNTSQKQIRMVDEDPTNPSTGDIWILRTIGAPTTYQLSFCDDGVIVRVGLT
jgi:hypothetical protein